MSRKLRSQRRAEFRTGWLSAATTSTLTSSPRRCLPLSIARIGPTSSLVAVPCCRDLRVERRPLIRSDHNRPILLIDIRASKTMPERPGRDVSKSVAALHEVLFVQHLMN